MDPNESREASSVYTSSNKFIRSRLSYFGDEKTEKRLDKHDLCTVHSLYELLLQTNRTQSHSERII